MRLQPLTKERLDDILSLEREVLACLERPDQLRRNTPEMWESCLCPPHMTIGLLSDDEVLVAVAVLYVPQPNSDEDLSALLKTGSMACGERGAANYKICLVHPHWRGQGYQQLLGYRLEEEAEKRGIGLLCATVSPHNTASLRSLQHLGYRYDSTLTKYGFDRQLWYKFLKKV